MRIVVFVAAAVFLVHMVTNHRYGFHRDELQVLDDARHLAWGYVVYPPFTPAVARLALEWFGASLVGLRMFSALACSLVIVLAGLIAREMGGGRAAQILAASMSAVAPILVIQGALFQYVAFDFLWWVLIAWLVIRLARTGDARLWVAIGGVIGIGVLTRFTIAFFLAGLVAGVLATPMRRHLRSPWLWAGVVVSIAIASPNLLWQVRNDFVSLEFLQSIHERDVRIGRTQGFLLEQFIVPASTFTIPWWVAGLWYCALSRDGKPYRIVAWMYLVPLVLFFVMQGRSYYLGPAYPMLLAAGAIVWEKGLLAWRPRLALGAASAAVAAGAVFGAAAMLPLAPVNSALWRFSASIHDNFVEQIGWPELVEATAEVHRSLSPQERERTAVLAANYGEAGAINLYGPGYGLPRAISGVNSHWQRGYGSPAPETVIVLGRSRGRAEQMFGRCDVGGRVTNRWGVENEESRDPAEILVCREPRLAWPELWARLRAFG